MDALGVVDLLDPVLNLLISIVKISVLGVVVMLLLEGPDKALRKGILGGLANICHADLDVVVAQQLDILRSRVLDALIGVMNGGRAVVGQRLLQGGQGQFVTQTATQMPAAYGACVQIEDHSQVHKARAQPQIRDIRRPDVIRIRRFHAPHVRTRRALRCPRG